MALQNNNYLLLTKLFKPLNPLTFANFSPSNCLSLLTHHHMFPYLALQSHPLSSFASAPLSALHQLFGTDSQKTSISLFILLTHLLISPILRLHSSLLHSTHDCRLEPCADVSVSAAARR